MDVCMVSGKTTEAFLDTKVYLAVKFVLLTRRRRMDELMRTFDTIGRHELIKNLGDDE